MPCARSPDSHTRSDRLPGSWRFWSSSVFMESFRLEKSFKLIGSNFWLNSSTSTKPHPQVQCLLIFEHLRGEITPPFLWAVHSNAYPFSEEIVQNIQPGSPLSHLEGFSPCFVPSCEKNWTLTSLSLLSVVVETNQVSPEPHFVLFRVFLKPFL